MCHETRSYQRGGKTGRAFHRSGPGRERCQTQAAGGYKLCGPKTRATTRQRPGSGTSRAKYAAFGTNHLRFVRLTPHCQALADRTEYQVPENGGGAPSTRRRRGQAIFLAPIPPPANLSAMKATQPITEYTTGQAARLIGLTPARLRQLAQAGEISARKQTSPLGDHWLISRAECLRIKRDRAR